MHFVVMSIMSGSSSLWGTSSSLSSICYNTAMSDSEASTRPPSTVEDFAVLENLTTFVAETFETPPLEPPADPEALLPLPGHRRKLLMERSVLQTGTATSQQSFTTRHTILLTPGALHRWRNFDCKAQKIVNAVSRHLGTLCLIQPSTVSMKPVSSEA